MDKDNSKIIEIDNEIDKSNYKNEMYNIDEEIHNNKKKINDIEDMEDQIKGINNRINECINIVNEMVEAKNTNNKFEYYKDMNNYNTRKTCNEFEEEVITTNKNINKLYETKEKLQKEYKDKESEKDND